MASVTQTHGGGQNYDRLHGRDSRSMLPTMGGAESEPVEITAVQKMLSATSGSLLTALLSTQPVALCVMAS